MSSNRFNTIDGFKPRKRGSEQTIQSPQRRSVLVEPKRRSAATVDLTAKKREANFKKNNLISKMPKLGSIKQPTSLIRKKTPAKVSKEKAKIVPFKKKESTRKATSNKIEAKISLTDPPKPKYRLLKRLIGWVFMIAIVLAAIYFGSTLLKATSTSNAVFRGNVFGLFNKKELERDQNDRTNFLIFGTSEDDPGHDAPFLTDSIMVASYSHSDRNLAMISIPRDLWVGLEKTCWVGNYSRINTVYQCASDAGKKEKAGANALKRQVSQITGLDIQYYLHVNFTVAEELVDAVGGVEVVIDSPDPRGIYDPAFDKWCNNKCNFVKYSNGPTGLLDGKHALALMMVRNSHGGYGLPNSNFDREKNQQRVITALVKKMTSQKTLLDINKINDMLDAIGSNLRTNIKTEEVQALVDVGRQLPADFDFDKMKSISFISDKKKIVQNEEISGASVLVPVDGVEDYRSINKYINRQLNPGVEEEEARVVVLNGSDKPGLASRVSDALRTKSVKIVEVGNNDQELSGKGYVYRKAQSKPKTSSMLSKKLGLAVKNKMPKQYSQYQADIVVVLGQKFDSKRYDG